MHIEPITATSTMPPPFTFAEEAADQPSTFVLAAPQPKKLPLVRRRLDWSAVGAAGFVYAVAFMAWTLLAR